MARVGEEFPLEYPNCGGDIQLIAFITETGSIRKILTHLGKPLEPPPLSPASGPPTDWGELVQADDACGCSNGSGNGGRGHGCKGGLLGCKKGC